MAVGDAPPSKPAGDAPVPGPPPPTFYPVPPSVAQGQPAPQSQQQQPPQQQGPPPPPGYYPPGAVPMPPPPPPTVVYAQVMPGYIMRPPRVQPQPGMVVVGYESKLVSVSDHSL
jgi:hypothetical protein